MLKPFPTRCICGAQRYSGHTISRAKFCVPMCSGCLQRLYEYAVKRTKEPVRDRGRKIWYHGKYWRYSQEERQ